jgi:hypothetical protein
MVGLLRSGSADKMLDLKNDALLDDIIVVWSHQIEIGELAAVLSALRNCEDIMVRIGFWETQLCGITEEWLLRVERRLPKK